MDNKNTGMDLYEALKSGLSADELQNQFMTDLAAAKARYQKEEDEKQQRAEELNELRSIVAGDLQEYFEMVFGKENCKNLTFKTIEQELKDLEADWGKNLNWIKDFNESWNDLEKILNETFSKNKSKTKEKQPEKKNVFDTKFKTDDDIIKEFLDSLK